MSSSRALAVGLAVLLAAGGQAIAAPPAPQAQGFLVERLYPSPAGAGWIVMDALDMHGDLGGALALNLGYERNPLSIADGTSRLAVVSDLGLADVGAALTYRRWRFDLDLGIPYLITGQSGIVGGYQFIGPSVDFGSAPDAISDVRFGTEVRIVGRPGGSFRFGAGAQLFVPTSNAGDYNTDGTFRGMIRALFAGDARYFTWAAQLGVHVRPRDDGPTPGGPQGSELLYGIAAGAKLPIGKAGHYVAILGPEVYGATAFGAFTDANATALEGLLSGRIEGTRDNRAQLRVKLGIGAGLDHHFGAAEWRVVVGVELFGQVQRPPPRR